MRLQRLIAALWFGSAVFLMLAASAAFRAAGNPTIAADVVGSMLTRWHYIALAAPLALFILELRRARRLIVPLLFTALVLAAMQSFVDLRIRAIRAVSPVAISDLDRTDPVRRRFGMLHGVSMMLLALQAIAAGVVVIARDPRTVEVVPSEAETPPEAEPQPQLTPNEVEGPGEPPPSPPPANTPAPIVEDETGGERQQPQTPP